MVSAEEISRILDADSEEAFREAQSKHSEIDNDDSNLRNTRRAMNYTVETLENEERYFDPAVAAGIWLDGEERKDMETILDEERIKSHLESELDKIADPDESSDTGILLKDFEHKISEESPLAYVNGRSEARDEIHTVGETEEIREYAEEVNRAYDEIYSLLKEFTEQIDEANTKKPINTIIDTHEEPFRADTVNIQELVDSHNLEVPENPVQFGKEFLQFLVDDYHLSVQEKSPEERITETQHHIEDRERTSTYEDQEMRFQSQAIPDTYDNMEKELVEAGAKYIHEEDEINVSDVRKLALEARSEAQDFEIERDTSFDGKSSAYASEIYQTFKDLSQREDYDLDSLIGAGSGSRDKIDQLIKGMEYAAKEGVAYETVEKTV